MIEEIFRKYLEIKSINDLNEVQKPSSSYSLNLIEDKDFQLNKFLFKKIGKKYHWFDRLTSVSYTHLTLPTICSV